MGLNFPAAGEEDVNVRPFAIRQEGRKEDFPLPFNSKKGKKKKETTLVFRKEGEENKNTSLLIITRESRLKGKREKGCRVQSHLVGEGKGKKQSISLLYLEGGKRKTGPSEAASCRRGRKGEKKNNNCFRILCFLMKKKGGKENEANLLAEFAGGSKGRRKEFLLHLYIIRKRKRDYHHISVGRGGGGGTGIYRYSSPAYFGEKNRGVNGDIYTS